MGMPAWKLPSLDLAPGQADSMPMGEVSADAMNCGMMNAPRPDAYALGTTRVAGRIRDG
jgi:hypothetical protein